MPTTTKKSGKTDCIRGWYCDTDDGGFEIGLDKSEKHSGTASGYIKSVVAKPKKFGNLMQWFAADEYLGKRLKTSGWVKTKLLTGTAQLWVRIDGDWGNARRDSFDNMGDRPIKGDTDWTQYSIVTDVPQTSTQIFFGLMLIGTGQIWLDDVCFEEVTTDVPITGNFTSKTAAKAKTKPVNLSFDQAGS